MTTAVRTEAGEAYLDLLKRCLTRLSDDGSPFLAGPANAAATPEQLLQGVFAHQDADTMIGWARLDNARHCLETALVEGVPGDVVETGTWRGGCCAYLRAVLAVHGVEDRDVWLADSFQGFPEPDAERYPEDYVYATPEVRRFLDGLDYPIAVAVDEVRARFARYGLLDEHVRFLPGFFADTLPTAPIGRIAVLRLDGDFYQSTIEALEHLYDRLSPGGFCIVDDYALRSCQRAVDDFRTARGITTPIERIDWTGAFWRKDDESGNR
ncbi:hypothetical protein GCM10022243_30320 [Saccharothrix violaceirubra]|uniref:Macrocin O-methyltransferase n=1 Tax=Saccharothrix violaceirubra TaxID=413306 RepID=A0A7W7T624_9PSEU|nr:TylF/MycF/NovP-related O-methyltransferase [Saccharothrix violaceirubra]MBB4966657.1 hypothetical protein [Saccharothrix violaceirubra]